MIPIVAQLLASGLGLIGNAVIAKGKEAIEQKIGIKLPDGDKPLDPATVVALKQAEISHEEWLIEAGIRRLTLEIEAEKTAQVAVTDRWKADMTSDSWLSKNIRPLTLAYLTVVISLMAFASQWLKVEPAWIELLKAAYLAVLTAYFIGRTVEKRGAQA